MNRDLLVNVITVTEDDGAYTADKSYAQINKAFARGTGAIVSYDNMMIPLVAVDNGYYFAAEILGKYVLVVIASTGVTVTETSPEAETSSDASASES